MAFSFEKFAHAGDRAEDLQHAQFLESLDNLDFRLWCKMSLWEQLREYV